MIQNERLSKSDEWDMHIVYHHIIFVYMTVLLSVFLHTCYCRGPRELWEADWGPACTVEERVLELSSCPLSFSYCGSSPDVQKCRGRKRWLENRAAIQHRCWGEGSTGKSVPSIFFLDCAMGVPWVRGEGGGRIHRERPEDGRPQKLTKSWQKLTIRKLL